MDDYRVARLQRNLGIVFVLFICSLIFGIASAYFCKKTEDKLNREISRRENTEKFMDSKSGGTRLWPGSHGEFINYNLRTFDGGRTWYVVNYDHDFRMTIVGESEKIYPGLLKHLDALNVVEERVVNKKTFDVKNKDDLKMLNDAGFSVK